MTMLPQGNSAMPTNGSLNSSGTDEDGLDMKTKPRSFLQASKRLVDVGVSLLFFAAFGWLLLLVALIVYITSGGPVIYSQPRVGKSGRVFKFYKFRSMVADAASVLEHHLNEDPAARKQWTDFQKLENDPRVTKFGAIIRRTSLDELPQFWNVLNGDMSLIGPRPCMPSQKELYGGYWKHYCSVRPGLTGLWQVSGRNKLSYKKRVALDVRYVETLSIFNDIQIFFRTVWVVLIGHGSR